MLLVIWHWTCRNPKIFWVLRLRPVSYPSLQVLPVFSQSYRWVFIHCMNSFSPTPFRLQPEETQPCIHGFWAPACLLCKVSSTSEWFFWMGPLSETAFLVAVDSPFVLNLPVGMFLTGGTLPMRNEPLQACLGSLSCAAWYVLKATPGRTLPIQLRARWQHSTQLHMAISRETLLSRIVCYCHCLQLEVSQGCVRCWCFFFEQSGAHDNHLQVAGIWKRGMGLNRLIPSRYGKIFHSNAFRIWSLHLGNDASITP